MRLLLASRNEGKLREVRQALAGLNLELESLQQHPGLPEVEETGATFAENARLKADYYFHKVGLPALADDSGLVVDALGGEPGVRSARYANSDALRIAKLLERLAGVREPARTARFVCALCLTGPAGRIEVSGEVEGRILEQPRGQGGFGYDPLFFYPPAGRTFAQMTLQQKNRVSHRARALSHLRAILARTPGLATLGSDPQNSKN